MHLMPSPCKGIGQITAPPRPATISDERAVPLKAEFLTFVVQGDTAVSLHHTRAGSVVFGLDEQNHTAFCAGRGQVHGAAGV